MTNASWTRNSGGSIIRGESANARERIRPTQRAEPGSVSAASRVRLESLRHDAMLVAR